MNAIDQARNAYSTSATPLRIPRTIEYDAFARITHQLKDAAEHEEENFPNLANALYVNRQLWTLLAVDVANGDNQLPRELRAQIFYLAEFTALHSSKVLDRAAKADVLVEINTSVMRGALLHKWADGRGSPFPGRTYPTASVTGMPSAV